MKTQVKTRATFMGPRTLPFLRHSLKRGCDGSSPICQIPKNPNLLPDQLQAVALSTPCHQSPVPRASLLPTPSSGDSPTVGERGHSCHHQGCSSPHRHVLDGLIRFPVFFPSLDSRDSDQGQQPSKTPQELALLQAAEQQLFIFK